MTAHGFLARWYRTRERRSSPRCSSYEARIQGGAAGAADEAAWWAWACMVWGRVSRELERGDAEVAERYFLGLSNAHISLLVWSSGGVEARRVADGEAPDTAADVQSWVDWKRMARDFGGVGAEHEVGELRTRWARVVRVTEKVLAGVAES